MILPREHANKTSQDQLKTTLRILLRKVWNRGWLSNDELQLGNQIHHELGIQPQRLAKAFAPWRQLAFAFGEKVPNETLECLCKCGIRNDTPVMFELPRCE